MVMCACSQCNQESRYVIVDCPACIAKFQARIDALEKEKVWTALETARIAAALQDRCVDLGTFALERIKKDKEIAELKARLEAEKAGG